MATKPCDELGLHLWEAGQQWDCALSPTTAVSLIDHVSARYGSTDFEVLLDEACGKYDLEGNERHAYKLALGLVFGTRAQVRLAARREAFAIPFAPH